MYFQPQDDFTLYEQFFDITHSETLQWSNNEGPMPKSKDLIRSNGVGPSAPDPKRHSSETPLMAAVRFGNLELVQLLLDANADMFCKDSLGHNVLHYVFKQIDESSREPFVKCFVETTMESDYQTENVINALLMAESSLTKVDVISIESESSTTEVAMRELKFKNAKVMLQYRQYETEVKTFFCDYIRKLIAEAVKRNLPIAESFVEHFNEWHVMNQDLVSVVVRIFEVADEEVIQQFLRCKVDVRVKDCFGINVLANLFGNENVVAVDFLKDRVYSLEMRTCNKQTPLHLAVSKVHMANIKLLLSRGANPNARDDAGQTPIFKSVNETDDLEESRKVVDILLRYEADVLLFDNEGESFVKNLIKDHNSHQICKNVVAYVAIAVAAEKQVDKSIIKLINKNKSLRYHYKVCLRQLSGLKSCKIRDRLTMFMIVSMKVERLFTIVSDKDQNVIKKSFTIEQNESLLPCFRRLIKNKLQMIRTLRNCRNEAAKILAENIDALKSNYDVSMEVLSYFSCAELLMFK